ncbi:hypothetical protein FWH58_00780 [Candidatus Saccharibacteria bacterium]|nr:hypothetical protein [Candidatus Saccharibacteria bacterium]
MNEKTPRSQLVAKIKSAGSILVTVSRNPNVDQLAAALGLTFMLDKLGKRATAVFSGEIPPAINFLEPEKTFESAIDSLRDFVISLDKEKADRLRYKVEGDLVKIYITPYKTIISEKDLEFNEGDFNIELVIAIGVQQKSYLDEAITANGRLLHSATVATLILGSASGDAFGTINWQDAEVSSLSEMVASLADDLADKENPLLDEQIATALLTGVVAATDQFRNEKTSAQVMTLAANLMAKGANQQLIASELSAGGEMASPTPEPDAVQAADQTEQPPDQAEPEEVLSISRDLTPEADQHLAANAAVVAAERSEDALSVVQEQLAALTDSERTAGESIQVPERPTDATAQTPAPESSTIAETDTLIANNSTILSHATPYAESAVNSPLNAAIAESDEPATIDPFNTKPPTPAPMINAAPVPPFASPSITLPPPPPPPIADLGELPPSMPTETPSPPIAESTPPPADDNPDDPTQFQIPN